MSAKKRIYFLLMWCVLLAVGLETVAAPKAKKGKADVPPVPLTASGEKLQEQYASLLNTVKGEILQALPELDEAKKAAFLQAFDAEVAAEKNVNEKIAALGQTQSAEGMLRHHQAWLDRATKGVAEAQAALSLAESSNGNAEEIAKAVNEAREALAKIQGNHGSAVKAVDQQMEAVRKAKLKDPQFVKELEEAEAARAQARAATRQAFDKLGLRPVLSGDKLDAKLAKYVVLAGGTPRGLAEFAEKSPEQEALVGKLLADDTLMIQMVAADGLESGKYGRAMEIYTAILNASPKASDGIFHQLALAVALEYAVPVVRGSENGAPVFVDPLKRYLHYEKAFLDGELDPGFKDLEAWELRMVVDGTEPEAIAAWGREMLRNYRPDHISTSDYRWRYVAAVKTDVKFGSREQKNDLPTLQNNQNIINTGGVCGRRAAFGRFILRCFGIPTVARPQTGHAALAHWTPTGWVINLGANWGRGKGVNQYPRDTDFLAMTQARQDSPTFLQVQRAQWIGDVMGESRAYGSPGTGAGSSLWNKAAFCRQQEIIDAAKAQTLEAVGQDIAEANESKETSVIEKVALTTEDMKIDVAVSGVITIPATACSTGASPMGPTIVFMKSALGGLQMHYNRVGPVTSFAYEFDAPQAGQYALTARVVTVSPNQSLSLKVGQSTEPVVISLPYTVGMWQSSDPVMITLVKGGNVLTFDRPSERRGVTIKDFTLTPVK